MSLFALKGDEGLLEKAVRTLARFHYEGSDGMDYTKCFPVDAFDRQSVIVGPQLFSNIRFLTLQASLTASRGLRRIW